MVSLEKIIYYYYDFYEVYCMLKGVVMFFLDGY